MRPFRLVRLGALLAVALPGPASAADLHVATHGSDSSGSGTLAAPYATPGKALAVAAPGDRVLVGPGAYASLQDGRGHGGVTLTADDPSQPPTIHGATLAGTSGLTLDGLHFDDTVAVRSELVHKTWYAHDIVFSNSSFSTPATCIVIRNGTYNLTLRDSDIGPCYTGIAGPGDGIVDPAQRPLARNIQILHNNIHDLIADGMQFGNWDDALVDGNRIIRMSDPTGVAHSDGIQVTGNSHRVRITNNLLQYSTQLIFAQDALGTNDTMLVANNVLTDGWGYSLQLGGTTNIEVTNNTVWRSRYGVIFRYRSQGTWSHNIFDRYVPGEGQVADGGFNLTYMRTAGAPAPTDLVKVDPQFVGAAVDDFHLLPTSPALVLRAGAFL